MITLSRKKFWKIPILTFQIDRDRQIRTFQVTWSTVIPKCEASYGNWKGIKDILVNGFFFQMHGNFLLEGHQWNFLKLRTMGLSCSKNEKKSNALNINAHTHNTHTTPIHIPMQSIFRKLPTKLLCHGFYACPWPYSLRSVNKYACSITNLYKFLPNIMLQLMA